MAHRTLLHSGGPGQNDWLTGTWYRKRWPWTLKSAHDYLKGEGVWRNHFHWWHTYDICNFSYESRRSSWQRPFCSLTRSAWSVSLCWTSSTGSATGFKAAGQDVHWSWSLLTRLPDGRQGSVSRRAVYHIRTILGDKHELEGSSLLYQSEAAKV
jgi:hypothetical protein